MSSRNSGPESRISISNGWTDNELFVTAIIETSRIAATTHRDEKLDYLKNVLVRVAVDSDSDEFLAMQMLRFVDTLEPEHFVVLKYCADPANWQADKEIDYPDQYSISPGSRMKGAQLPVEGESLEIVMRDLSERALVDLEGAIVDDRSNIIWRPLATGLGQSLLELVSESG